jgi:hypothetical protein
MITLQTRLHVDGLTGRQVYDFLLNCTDRKYQEWWPGTHLQFHTVRRLPGDVGNTVYMDEFIGDRRVRMRGVVTAVLPERRMEWRWRKGIPLPARLTLDFDTDERGVWITHTLSVGWRGVGAVIDPLVRLYVSARFAAAMDEHVRTEFSKLSDFLNR